MRLPLLPFKWMLVNLMFSLYTWQQGNADKFTLGYLTGASRRPWDKEYSRPGLSISGEFNISKLFYLIYLYYRGKCFSLSISSVALRAFPRATRIIETCFYDCGATSFSMYDLIDGNIDSYIFNLFKSSRRITYPISLNSIQILKDISAQLCTYNILAGNFLGWKQCSGISQIVVMSKAFFFFFFSILAYGASIAKSIALRAQAG